MDWWACSWTDSVTVACMLFQRCRNVFWCINVYTTQPGYASVVVVLLLRSKHARQMVLGRGVEFVWCISDWSRLQCLHIRGVPGASIEQVGHEQMVATRVYRSCCCFAVGRKLTRESWLDGILRERKKLYNAWVSGGWGLSWSGSRLRCCILQRCNKVG